MSSKKEIYKELLKKTKLILAKNMEKYHELIFNATSLIANISFYEKGVLMVNDFELIT